MIFGFNTDIRHDDTVYHVQSEAREGEQLLQTQVFVRGRCSDGKLDSIFDKRDTPETLAALKELDLEWINARSVHSSGALTMHIRVTDGGATVEGARLTLRFARPDAAPYYAQVLTDAKGDAEMSVQVDENSLSDSSVVVQVSFAGRTATRKFQLRAAN